MMTMMEIYEQLPFSLTSPAFDRKMFSKCEMRLSQKIEKGIFSYTHEPPAAQRFDNILMFTMAF